MLILNEHDEVLASKRKTPGKHGDN